jgi:hypothetical protein
LRRLRFTTPLESVVCKHEGHSNSHHACCPTAIIKLFDDGLVSIDHMGRGNAVIPATSSFAILWILLCHSVTSCSPSLSTTNSSGSVPLPQTRADPLPPAPHLPRRGRLLDGSCCDMVAGGVFSSAVLPCLPMMKLNFLTGGSLSLLPTPPSIGDEGSGRFRGASGGISSSKTWLLSLDLFPSHHVPRLILVRAIPAPSFPFQF